MIVRTGGWRSLALLGHAAAVTAGCGVAAGSGKRWINPDTLYDARKFYVVTSRIATSVPIRKHTAATAGLATARLEPPRVSRSARYARTAMPAGAV